ncbi:3-hydroxyacyl-ACP dehydratase FabZ family protein [Streptomyces griseosporeus]|uniref:3-hydroxyacyl-ACP dehydratase FabZ family protein n=1 Tax=Streptomyces griseosporeus TaxID=1910 RepID=UPI0036FBB418
MDTALATRAAATARAPRSTAYPVRPGARRMPLVAVDDVRAAGKGFVGRKTIDPGDPYLRGHFPSLTVYPGVFLVESLQQMLEVHLDGALGGVELVELGSVRFSRPALAGDEVVIEAEVDGDRDRLVTKATCSSGGQRLARITATWRCRP